MLIRDFVEVALPIETVVSRVADPRLWTRVLDGDLDPDDHTLLARFGISGLFAALGRRAEVRVGAPRRQERGTVIDLQWQAAGGAGWLPVMHADLSLSALGAAATHVEFSGSYSPPGGLPGRVADRVVLHHVAEYAVRIALTRMVDDLTGVRT